MSVADMTHPISIHNQRALEILDEVDRKGVNRRHKLRNRKDEKGDF